MSLDVLDLQIDALNAARSMDVDQAEAILRVEKGSVVNIYELQKSLKETYYYLLEIIQNCL
jgi:hypothetical protein